MFFFMKIWLKGMGVPKRKNVPVLSSMRSSVDVCDFEQCPLNLLPSLNPGLKQIGRTRKSSEVRYCNGNATLLV